jgi:hypothetical protein
LAYLGNRPAESFASFEKQVFTIVNSQTAYTLSHSVTNENDIRLVVNNVVQEPGSGKAYTASGTTLTLSAALTNGTDEMYCVFLGRALQTVNAPNASVGSDQTAPTIITGQTAETSIATDDTILIHDTSASALRKMTRANFVSGIGGTNTPAWCVRKSANQSIATNTRTLITYDTEIFDTDSAFSSNTFTVPSGEGGKYFIFAYLRINSATNFENINSLIGVNGTMEMSAWGANDYYETLLIQGILDLSAGDTVNHYGRQDSGGNLNVGATDQGINTMFGGYKLIGV